MSIKLYIKTHNQTGLKYFGKTKQDDPYGYYGSGTYWRNHLKKYGNDISTEILAEFEDECEELIITAINFSRENNIVESDNWANLIEENGLDGVGPNVTDDFRRKVGKYSKDKAVYIDENGDKIKIDVQEAKERGLIAESKGRKYSDEINKKKGSVGIKNGMYGKTHSDEAKQKQGLKSKNTITCFDLEEKIMKRIPKELFYEFKNIKYVGTTSKYAKEYYENKKD